MAKRTDYEEAESRIEAARNAAEAARRAIAQIPGAPNDYWAGLATEAGPLASAWHEADRAVGALSAAESFLTTAQRSRAKEVAR